MARRAVEGGVDESWEKQRSLRVRLDDECEREKLNSLFFASSGAKGKRARALFSARADRGLRSPRKGGEEGRSKLACLEAAEGKGA